MPNINVNGNNIFYRDDGDKEKPVVLCLHSLFLDSSMFDELTEKLKDEFRIVRPDFRGQGKSDTTDEHIIECETLADDIEKFIEMLNLGKVNAVVQSMGGDVILRVAQKRTDLFKSLVLLGTSARNEPEEQLAFVEKFLEDSSKSGFVGEHLETLTTIMFGESTRQAKENIVSFWKEKMRNLPLSLWPSMRGVVYRKSVVSKLHLIDVPALIISGAEDMVRPGEWADELAHGIKGAKHIRLPRTGHSVIIESPNETIPEIRRFIQTVCN